MGAGGRGREGLGWAYWIGVNVTLQDPGDVVLEVILAGADVLTGRSRMPTNPSCDLVPAPATHRGWHLKVRHSRQDPRLVPSPGRTAAAAAAHPWDDDDPTGAAVGGRDRLDDGTESGDGRRRSAVHRCVRDAGGPGGVRARWADRARRRLDHRWPADLRSRLRLPGAHVRARRQRPGLVADGA